MTSPRARELARAEHRSKNRIRQFTASGYDAIRSSGKRKAASTVLKHEDEQLKNGDRHKMLHTTRRLARNFALVPWAIRKHLDYVTRFDFQMRTPNAELNTAIERLMTQWQRPANCDAAGRHTFSKMLRLFETRRVIDGDVYALKMVSGALSPIEADRIRQPSKIEEGQAWFNGVQVTPTGTARRYAVWNRKGTGFEPWKNIAAGNVIPFGYFERFDQVRGISPLTAATNSFQDVYEGIDSALAKMKVEQLFAMVFYRDATSGVGTTSGSDDAGYEVDFGKGPIQLDLDPGDKADFLKTDNPGSNTREFMNAVLSIALKCLDLPYNFFDEAHTNFFGSRAAFLQYDRSSQAKRDDVQEFLRRVTLWKFRQWILTGQLVIPDSMTTEDLRFEWVHRGMPWWDPVKEVNGAVAAIKAGLDNPYRVCKESGVGEYEDNIDKIAQAMEYARNAGVPLEYAMLPVVEDTEEHNTRGRA